MKKILLLLAVFGGVIFSACNKEETPVTPPAPTCTLTKYTNPDNSYTVITRNGAGKYLTVKNFPPSGSFSSYMQYEYAGDRVSKIASFNGANQLLYYLTFEKTSYGELVHVNIPAGGIFVEQAQLEYHMSGNHITKVVSKGQSGSSFSPVRQDDYTFSGDNVTKVVTQDLQNQSTTTTTYTYDAKKSPYRNGDFGPDPEQQSVNNITSKTENAATESYTYTYNNTGFAATRSIVGNGKSTTTYTYTGCN
jgi:hypothetical protein